MAQEHIAILLEETQLTLEELAVSCLVSRDWVIEQVHAGVLLQQAPSDPETWSFSSRDLIRARRLLQLEHAFDANPELAGLVADLFEELERLRTRLRREGLSLE